MKIIFRFAVVAILAFSIVFASSLPAKAAFVVMPNWQQQAYVFDALAGGGPSPFTFNVWALVEHDNDLLSATFNQFRYNYWIENLADNSGIGWQSLEIRLFGPIIASGTILGSGDQPVRAGPWVGQPGGVFPGENVFFARDDSLPGWLPEGLRSDTFWFTSFTGPGAGFGAGEGTGAGWVLNNPGEGGFPAPIPEPGTMALLGLGIVGIGFLRKARLKNS